MLFEEALQRQDTAKEGDAPHSVVSVEGSQVLATVDPEAPFLLDDGTVVGGVDPWHEDDADSCVSGCTGRPVEASGRHWELGQDDFGDGDSELVGRARGWLSLHNKCCRAGQCVRAKCMYRRRCARGGWTCTTSRSTRGGRPYSKPWTASSPCRARHGPVSRARRRRGGAAGGRLAGCAGVAPMIVVRMNRPAAVATRRWRTTLAAKVLQAIESKKCPGSRGAA